MHAVLPDELVAMAVDQQEFHMSNFTQLSVVPPVTHADETMPAASVAVPRYVRVVHEYERMPAYQQFYERCRIDNRMTTLRQDQRQLTQATAETTSDAEFEQRRKRSSHLLIAHDAEDCKPPAQPRGPIVIGDDDDSF